MGIESINGGGSISADDYDLELADEISLCSNSSAVVKNTNDKNKTEKGGHHQKSAKTTVQPNSKQQQLSEAKEMMSPLVKPEYMTPVKPVATKQRGDRKKLKLVVDDGVVGEVMINKLKRSLTRKVEKPTDIPKVICLIFRIGDPLYLALSLSVYQYVMAFYLMNLLLSDLKSIVSILICFTILDF